jgi:3'(2'), 5'-bisphosphate nucleotidase
MLVIVRAAGAEVMRVYEAAAVEARVKADQSPVTEADLASHQVIVRGLERLTPRLPIVSEEGGVEAFAERSCSAAHWLVDPLDGTKEFLAHNGEFTVNLALVEDGRPTLGVVGVPARGQAFIGDVRRRLARRLDRRGSQDLRARVYAGAVPVIVASRRHGNAQLEGVLEAIERTHGAVDVRSVGSALKLCLLAEGEADLYPRLAPTCEWDTAAAQAVLEAAGGAVLQLDGTALVYSKPDVRNPVFVAVADPGAGWLRYFLDAGRPGPADTRGR